MKKILSVSMAAAMTLSLAACGAASSESTAASSETTTSSATSEAGAIEASAVTGIAQCCDVGTIDDESFNQAAGKPSRLTVSPTAWKSTTICRRTILLTKTARP